LSQLGPLYTPPTNLPKIHSDLILPSSHLLSTKYHQDNKINEGEVSRGCNTGGCEIHIKVGRDHLKNIGVDGRIILQDWKGTLEYTDIPKVFFTPHHVIFKFHQLLSPIIIIYDLQSTDHELIPARNPRAEVMFVTIQRENIRPSKKEMNKAVTMLIIKIKLPDICS
jgi:hypothetical protein